MTEPRFSLEMFAEAMRVGKEFERQTQAIQAAAGMSEVGVAKLRERVIAMAQHLPDPPIVVLRREGEKAIAERKAAAEVKP